MTPTDGPLTVTCTFSGLRTNPAKFEHTVAVTASETIVSHLAYIRTASWRLQLDSWAATAPSTVRSVHPSASSTIAPAGGEERLKGEHEALVEDPSGPEAAPRSTLEADGRFLREVRCSGMESYGRPVIRKCATEGSWSLSWSANSLLTCTMSK